VIRIAERADVSVQTLYSNWGKKRNLLRAVMESSSTGDEDVRWSPGGRRRQSPPPSIRRGRRRPAQAADPPEPPVPAGSAERSAAAGRPTGGAGVDPDIGRGLAAAQRPAPGCIFHALCAQVPAGATARRAQHAAAADTAWVIAQPGRTTCWCARRATATTTGELGPKHPQRCPAGRSGTGVNLASGEWLPASDLKLSRFQVKPLPGPPSFAALSSRSS